MTQSQSPRILNLDELPTPASMLTIRHEGVDHTMVQLTVEGFIDQQNRAAEHQALAEQKLKLGATGATDEEIEDVQRKVVEVVRDAVVAFFPSLPVDQMPVTKMFAVFGWLNDVSQQINQKYAPEETSEGNVLGETSSQS